MATFASESAAAARPRPPLMGLGRLRKRDRQQGRASNGLRRDRRRSSLSYGVMVIDMGVHQLSGLPQKVNLVQVCAEVPHSVYVMHHCHIPNMHRRWGALCLLQRSLYDAAFWACCFK